MKAHNRNMLIVSYCDGLVSDVWSQQFKQHLLQPLGQLQANFTEMILRWYLVKVVQKN